MKNLVLRAFHEIPIFDLHFFLYVSHNATKTYNHVAKRWGTTRDDGFDALAIMDDDGAFAAFFCFGDITEKNIAHEVDHLVNDFMMPYIGQPRCKKCSNESHAHLAGYLQKWIKGRLKRAGLDVR